MKEESPLHFLPKTRREKEEGDHKKWPLQIPRIPIEDSKGNYQKLNATIATSMVTMPENARKREMLQGPTVASTISLMKRRIDNDGRRGDDKMRRDDKKC